MDKDVPEEETVYWDPAVSILSSCCFSVPVRGGCFEEHLNEILIDPQETEASIDLWYADITDVDSCGVGVCSRCGKVIDFYCIPQILDTIADGGEMY